MVVTEVQDRVIVGIAFRVAVLSALQPDDTKTFNPAVRKRAISTARSRRKQQYTDMSARSKLSLKMPVTLRNMSRLSVAKVRIFWAACVAPSTVGGVVLFGPALPCLECPCALLEPRTGDVAREAGRDRGEGPASPGP